MAVTAAFLSQASAQEDPARNALRAKIAELQAAEANAIQFRPTLNPQREQAMREAVRAKKAELEAAEPAPMTASATPAPTPAPTPRVPVDLSQLPQDRDQRLKELTRLYIADLIPARTYHQERAKLIAPR